MTEILSEVSARTFKVVYACVSAICGVLFDLFHRAFIFILDEMAKYRSQQLLAVADRRFGCASTFINMRRFPMFAPVRLFLRRLSDSTRMWQCVWQNPRGTFLPCALYCPD